MPTSGNIDVRDTEAVLTKGALQNAIFQRGSFKNTSIKKNSGGLNESFGAKLNGSVVGLRKSSGLPGEEPR